jgi:Macrocin-O-methyltransferase (TylF)
MSDLVLSIYDEFLRGTGVDRLQKILARYELFRMIMDRPGDIVECGVFKGSGIYTWTKLVQTFKPNSSSRVIGFDFFDANRDVALKHRQDQKCLDFHAEGWTSPATIKANCAKWGFERVQLIAGDIRQTTKEFAETELGARISLLYIDVDNYEATKAILTNLYPRVVPGGIVAFDEYGLRGFGEADAVDEYFSSRSIKLQSLPWAATPSAFLVKDEAADNA